MLTQGAAAIASNRPMWGVARRCVSRLGHSSLESICTPPGGLAKEPARLYQMHFSVVRQVSTSTGCVDSAPGSRSGSMPFINGCDTAASSNLGASKRHLSADTGSTGRQWLNNHEQPLLDPQNTTDYSSELAPAGLLQEDDKASKSRLWKGTSQEKPVNGLVNAMKDRVDAFTNGGMSELRKFIDPMESHRVSRFQGGRFQNSGTEAAERRERQAEGMELEGETLKGKARGGHMSDSGEDGSALSHVDREGRAQMVDTGDKVSTSRVAVAAGRVLLGRKAFELVHSNKVGKGDVLTVAKIAGINGAKLTANLIPLCHNIVLSSVEVELSLDREGQAVDIVARARAVGTTGVEMEAMTAVTVAGLTVYDMCKAVSNEIEITEVRLLEKVGGKSGHWLRGGSKGGAKDGVVAGYGSVVERKF